MLTPDLSPCHVKRLLCESSCEEIWSNISRITSFSESEIVIGATACHPGEAIMQTGSMNTPDYDTFR